MKNLVPIFGAIFFGQLNQDCSDNSEIKLFYSVIPKLVPIFIPKLVPKLIPKLIPKNAIELPPRPTKSLLNCHPGLCRAAAAARVEG